MLKNWMIYFFTLGEPLARCDLRGHTHTHLEAGDHGPVLPLLIVSDYNVDGATKGPKNKSNPVIGKFTF